MEGLGGVAGLPFFLCARGDSNPVPLGGDDSKATNSDTSCARVGNRSLNGIMLKNS